MRKEGLSKQGHGAKFRGSEALVSATLPPRPPHPALYPPGSQPCASIGPADPRGAPPPPHAAARLEFRNLKPKQAKAANAAA